MLRVILYHIIKQYQYRQIIIDKQCIYKRSTDRALHTHLHSP